MITLERVSCNKSQRNANVVTKQMELIQLAEKVFGPINHSVWCDFSHNIEVATLILFHWFLAESKGREWKVKSRVGYSLLLCVVKNQMMYIQLQTFFVMLVLVCSAIMFLA